MNDNLLVCKVNQVSQSLRRYPTSPAQEVPLQEKFRLEFVRNLAYNSMEHKDQLRY